MLLMKQIITDFFSFIKKPKDVQYSGNDQAYKWKVFFTLIGFNLLFSIIYMGVFSLLEKIYPLEHKLDDLDYSPILTILLIAIIVPFIEEVFFRLILRRKGILKSLFTVEKWNKYFFVLVYISTVSFALIHITNYKFDSYFFLLLAPFLTLSQFVSGFIMTFLRVRFNFWMGFAFHALWNFSAIMVSSPEMFQIQNQLENEVNIKNQHFELTVSKQNFKFNQDKSIIYTANLDTVYQLESNGFSGNDILEALAVPANDYFPLVDKFDIKFKSEKGIPTDSLLHILEKEKILKKKAKTN